MVKDKLKVLEELSDDSWLKRNFTVKELIALVELGSQPYNVLVIHSHTEKINASKIQQRIYNLGYHCTHVIATHTLEIAQPLLCNIYPKQMECWVVDYEDIITLLSNEYTPLRQCIDRLRQRGMDAKDMNRFYINRVIQGLRCGYRDCCILEYSLKNIDHSTRPHHLPTAGSYFQPCKECLNGDPVDLVMEIQSRRDPILPQFPFTSTKDIGSLMNPDTLTDDVIIKAVRLMTTGQSTPRSAMYTSSYQWVGVDNQEPFKLEDGNVITINGKKLMVLQIEGEDILRFYDNAKLEEYVPSIGDILEH